MRSITMALLATVIASAVFCACTGEMSTASDNSSQTVDTADTAAVQIIYFHGKQRCANCIAIESETRTLVENELAPQSKDGKVKFIVVDITTKEGQRLAEKFKVTFSSLFMVTRSDTEDLTRFAFANARAHADVFRKELRDKVMQAVN